MSDFGSGPFTGQPQMMPIAPPEGTHPHTSGSASHGSWVSPEPKSDKQWHVRTAIIIAVLVVLALIILLGVVL